MKKRHTPEQIIRKLREAEGHPSGGMTADTPMCCETSAPSFST